MTAALSYSRSLLLGTATVFAAVLSMTPAATAGDLGGEEYIEQGAYDFEDIEENDGRRYAGYGKDGDDDYDGGEVRHSYNDNGYLREYGHPPRFSDNGHNGRHACIPRDEIKRELRADGWRDFHGARPKGEVVVVKARRNHGQLHRLTVDRCSGQIVNVQIIDEIPPEALAERDYRRYRTY